MTDRSFFLLFATLFAFAAMAQDTLFYTNGDTIYGQVDEVRKDEILYRTSNAGNAVTITVDKLELDRLHLASGQRFAFRNAGGEQRSARYAERINLFSLDFIAPALDHITVGFERLIKPNMSLSVKAGYLSLGIYEQNYQQQKPTGTLLKTGVNFYLPPSQKRQRSGRTLHPLSGWYLGPELLANSWRQDRASYLADSPRDQYTSLCLDVVVGRKLVIGEQLTFDFYGGIGYGLQWVNGTYTENTDEYSNPYVTREQYGYSHLFVGNSPLILTAGLMFGYLF